VAAFVPGLELSRAFYHELVRPVLMSKFPGLAHDAALIGPGSEVLGLDTEQSTDHDWGPRLQIFLSDADHQRYAPALSDELARRLPPAFRGYSTSFSLPDAGGVRLMAPMDRGAISHWVEVCAIGSYLEERLGFDPRHPVGLLDWLLTPSQRLLETTAGAVYHDNLGELGRVRTALAWYPHDVWLYVIACQWQRIAEEEAFVGRCGQAGDEAGAAVVAARLVRDLMRLCFLFERRYAPYSKWLGSAFARLTCAKDALPLLDYVLAASDRHTRESRLARAYELIAGMHNRLGITPAVDPVTRPFHDRPFRVLMAERFADATRQAIVSEDVRGLPPVGSVDQFADSTAVLSSPAHWRRFAALFG
jgi:hypothetical protein